MKIVEVECKSALSKCGFPGGGWAINPYVGCGHGCVYCYARFMRRFTGHSEAWGSFVDVRVNMAEVLRRQLGSPKFRKGHIYVGTVTDPYQPIEKKYEVTRKILEVLRGRPHCVSILTKSDLVLRDIDLLRGFGDVDVSFTVNTLDERWRERVEPYSPSIERRFAAMRKLSKAGVKVCVMMGPYWPVFTDAEGLFKRFKEAGVAHVFTESLNTVGGNWVGVGELLRKHYPELLDGMREIFFDELPRSKLRGSLASSASSFLAPSSPPLAGFSALQNKRRFDEFYCKAEGKVRELSRKYQMPVTIYFGRGHAAKFR